MISLGSDEKVFYIPSTESDGPTFCGDGIVHPSILVNRQITLGYARFGIGGKQLILMHPSTLPIFLYPSSYSPSFQVMNLNADPKTYGRWTHIGTWSSRDADVLTASHLDPMKVIVMHRGDTDQHGAAALLVDDDGLTLVTDPDGRLDLMSDMRHLVTNMRFEYFS